MLWGQLREGFTGTVTLGVGVEGYKEGLQLIKGKVKHMSSGAVRCLVGMIIGWLALAERRLAGELEDRWKATLAGDLGNRWKATLKPC